MRLRVATLLVMSSGGGMLLSSPRFSRTGISHFGHPLMYFPIFFIRGVVLFNICPSARRMWSCVECAVGGVVGWRFRFAPNIPLLYL